MNAYTQPIQSNRVSTRRISVRELLLILEKIPKGFQDLYIIDSQGQYLEVLADEDWKEPKLSTEKGAAIIELA